MCGYRATWKTLRESTSGFEKFAFKLSKGVFFFGDLQRSELCEKQS